MRLLAALTIATLACVAQAPAKLEFEVASIKVAPPFDVRTPAKKTGGPGTKDPTRVTLQNQGMGMLLMLAFDVKAFQLHGADMMAAERYDVSATMPPGTTQQQYQVMMQNLLAERFNLKVHREVKEGPTFDLVVGKGGSKLKEFTGDAPASDAATRIDRDGNAIPAPGKMGMNVAGGRMRFTYNGAGQSMQDLAAYLSATEGRPVIDATGLSGKFDFLLTWSFETSPPPSEPGGGPAPRQDVSELVAEGLQSLGLKLVPKKGPIESLIVDHVDKVPTRN